MDNIRTKTPPRVDTQEPIDRTKSPDSRTECPECDGTLQRSAEQGETACRECGLVVREKTIDRGPEWRAFSAQERESRSRVGAPSSELRHDNGLSTRIDWRNKDGYGKQLSARKRKLFKRLRTWDERFVTKNARERNLKQAFGEIDRMASALGLPKPCRETAGVIYRRAVERELLPGRSIEGMATASLYAGARQHGTPRTLVEFETVSRVEKLRIQRAYRYLSQELDLQLEPADPLQYVPQFSSALEISDEAEGLSRELLEAAKAEALHSGRSPASIAAAALYAAGRLSNEDVTQEAVSDIAHVSCVTIRKRYTEILDVYAEYQDDR
ncbi:TFIIB-type zinc ribbon-containing protein [Halostagnicola sp. A-GB9-2]|uniref:transcription initiation factor IIB n=1 Tax=Halostagnicola sp. A-GB9-2 TaxID=3048066 RepID=UPI0024BFC5EE|nr:TFIIB-type zinc ribbon-containing protein [Halostagnicola sp. A-GB9-2]MDJ1431046.1 TFIIB-type zinc ribbon-containing protein [Halostagnicola sp. A-GB9-2]